MAVALLLCACGGDDAPAEDDPCKPAVESVPTPPLSTPRWAFEPWISKDISTADDTRAFVQGFRERDIPVGAVVLDSPWETHYNTFVPNPNRYPNFGELVQELHDDQIRVVLWIREGIAFAKQVRGLDAIGGKGQGFCGMSDGSFDRKHTLGAAESAKSGV